MATPADHLFLHAAGWRKFQALWLHTPLSNVIPPLSNVIPRALPEESAFSSIEKQIPRLARDDINNRGHMLWFHTPLSDVIPRALPEESAFSSIEKQIPRLTRDDINNRSHIATGSYSESNKMTFVTGSYSIRPWNYPTTTAAASST